MCEGHGKTDETYLDFLETVLNKTC